MLFSKKKKRKAKPKPRKKKAKKKITKRAKAKKRPGRAKAQKRKRVIKRASKKSKIEGTQIGKVSHYFPHVKAGAITIEKGTLAAGDVIHIKGHTTDFKQKIKSLQIDWVPIDKGKAGDEVGVLLKSRVRINDTVYKLKS